MELLQPEVDLEDRIERFFGAPSDPMLQLESRARSLFPGRDTIVWEAAADTLECTYIDISAERVLGYPRALWTSRPGFWAETIHEEDRVEALAQCALVTGTGKSRSFTYRAVTIEGEVVQFLDVIRAYKGRKGVPLRLRGILLMQ